MDTHSLAKWQIYERSHQEVGGTRYALARQVDGVEKRLVVQSDTTGFSGAPIEGEDGGLLCSLTPENLAVLRARLPHLSPVTLGLSTSAGFGDRLGLATPGHIWAARGTGIAPIFAQQSVRENTRTGRTPQQVLDDATWGVFQEGWTEPWGADGDHLKEPADIEAFAAAGYTFFTFDPGAYVDNEAHTCPVSELHSKVSRLPWGDLESSPEALYAAYLDRTIRVETLDLTFTEETLLRAAAKYGAAVAHAARMYRALATAMGSRPFEVEVSVDETETPTSIHEHYFIALELARLGVHWVSLAPRFPGRFEKGVDFIGDMALFEHDLQGHAAIARGLGPYKLSLHSGSDKFSIYPLVQAACQGLVHVKTAGTSYLEALRVLAKIDPSLFCALLEFSRARYDNDRASYHVSARYEKVPASGSLAEAELPGLLDAFDARQVLHVAFGSVLEQFGGQLKAALNANEAAYYEGLERHFARHLQPFIPAA